MGAQKRYADAKAKTEKLQGNFDELEKKARGWYDADANKGSVSFDRCKFNLIHRRAPSEDHPRLTHH